MRPFKHLHDHTHGPDRDRRFARAPHERPERHERHHERHFGGGRGRLARFLEHGDLKMLVLHLINQEARHGYEIIKAIEDLTGGAYAPSPGVVYPTLTLLEELGQVTSTADGTRKRFAITESGRQVLAENQADVEVILARIAKMQNREAAPAIIRATENVKTALRLKLGGAPLAPETIKQIARLLDEAARNIEEL